MIGNRADIENVPIDKLQAFYKKFYQPDNAVLTVSGKIDEAKLLPMISDYFSPIPAPTRKLETTYTVEPAQDGERQVTLRRVGIFKQCWRSITCRLARTESRRSVFSRVSSATIRRVVSTNRLSIRRKRHRHSALQCN